MRRRFEQPHLGTGHEFFDIEQDQHAVADRADGQQVVGCDAGVELEHWRSCSGVRVITSDTASTTMPITRLPMLSTITAVKLTVSSLNLSRMSTMGTIAPRRQDLDAAFLGPELIGEELAQAGVDGPGAGWQRCDCRADLDGCLQAHGGNSLVVLGVQTILAR